MAHPVEFFIRFDQWTVSFLGIFTTIAKTNKLASLFIAHLPINSELISLVMRCHLITSSLSLKLKYFS